MADMFLSLDELATLTGRKVKAKQIEALRRMKLPFFVNACGRAVVARAAVEGSASSGLGVGRNAVGWRPSIFEG